MTTLHHSAICTTDVEASMSFWRDALGFEQLMDHRFAGDWPTLFAAGTSELRSIFLGDPASPECGIVELVVFDPIEPADAPAAVPRPGFFLLSIFCDLEATLAGLAERGLGGEPRRIDVQGTAMATVVDPNGVLVELIDQG